MLTKSKNCNINYLAQIIKVGMVEPVPNSDNLVRTSVQGNTVVCSKGIKPGDMMIYFPVECQIQDWYLKKNNMYRDSTKNEDSEKKGFFEDNGRVKCLKLRNQPSQGLLMPMYSLLSGSDYDIDNDLIGVEFDTFENNLLVKKYTTKYKDSVIREGRERRNKDKITSKVIDTQFRFHIDTPQLGKNIQYINPNDIINITRKTHGIYEVWHRLDMLDVI